MILLVKNETFKKGDETKGLFSRFFHLLLPQKKLLLHIFVASLIYTILGIVGAFYFKELIDSVLPDGLRKTLTTLSIGVILLNVFKVILNAFRSHLLLYLSQKLDIALLLGYYRHVIAEKFAFEKRLIVSTLKQNGIYSLLTTPENLSIDVINKYLEMKSRQLL